MSSHKRHLTHPKYRPDIDGLRAVAVLSVVSYHAFPSWIKGGFIGVDVFFVISGFLISTIIFSNLEHERFTLAEFYFRRIKRIFPALILVLIACYMLGWFVLYADEFKNLSKHIAGGAGFISNYVFLWTEGGYFDAAAETKPLFHLWSLAIEEQFYICWPLLLMIVWKRNYSFVLITMIVAVISFTVNIYEISKSPTSAFLLPIPRFWELMIGGILAYIELHRPQLNSRYRNPQSILGVGLLVLGLMLVNRDRSFPGWWALLPTCGAFLIISAGPNTWLNKTLLSNKLLVWIGLISYPLYLWHWPLLSLANTVYVHPSIELRLAIVLLSFILAWLTLILLEHRIRWSKHIRTVNWLAVVLFVVFLIGYVSFAADGFPGRKINKPFAKVDSQMFHLTRQSDQSCLEKLKLHLVSEEVCLTNSDAPQILFTGDSRAMSLYSAIYGKYYDTPSVMIAGQICELYPNLEYTPTYKYHFGNNCTSIANEVINFAKKSSSIKTVILARRIPLGFPNKLSRFHAHGHQLTEEEAFFEGNGYLIDQLLHLGKDVIFFMDVPFLKVSPKDCVRPRLFAHSMRCTFSRIELDRSRRNYRAAVRQLNERYPKLRIFDPTDLICDKQTCYSKGDNGEYYHDRTHLNEIGSKKVLGVLLGFAHAS